MSAKSNGGQPTPSESESSTREPSDLQIEQDDLVIFGEDGKFYLIPKTDYATNELPVALMSTAEFVVGLGSIITDIPSFDWDSSRYLMGDEAHPLTDRCSCIVLNLAVIRQVSEKETDRTITFLDDSDKRRGSNGKRTCPRLHVDGKKADPNLRLGMCDLVIFGEDRKFYWVKQQDYQKIQNELPPEMSSAPELMVKLGSLAADIPRIPTAGTACVLLNLLAVKRGSDYAARVLEENIQSSRLPSTQSSAEQESLRRERDADARQRAEARKQAAQRLKEWAAHAREFNEAAEQKRLDTLFATTQRQLRLTRLRDAALLEEVIAQLSQAEASSSDAAHKQQLQLRCTQLQQEQAANSDRESRPPASPESGRRRFQPAAARTIRPEKKSRSKTGRKPRGKKT